MAVVMTEFTANVQVDISNIVTGDGIFDDMMESVNVHIKAQFDEGRINGSDYATVYLGALQSVISESVQILLAKDKVSADVVLTTAQEASEGAKKLLIERQTQGFDDDAKQKLLKQALDSWSVAYSVAQDANSIPDSIKVDSIDNIMNNALQTLNVIDAGIALPTNPLGIASYDSGGTIIPGTDGVVAAIPA